MGSWGRADSVGSRGGADSVGFRGGAGSGADSLVSRSRVGSRADSVGSRSGLSSGLCGLPDWSGLCHHSPPVKGLLKVTIEEVLEGCIVVPQALGCPTEPQGKLPHIIALLTEGAQGLKLKDALVEGAADVRGWWTVDGVSPFSASCLKILSRSSILSQK